MGVASRQQSHFEAHDGAAVARDAARHGRPSSRGRDLLRRLMVWCCRHASSEQMADAAETPATFPIEGYNAALDRLVEIARESGARQEQARMRSIATLPQAAGFPRMALNLALSGVVTPEQAIEAFAAAESDVLARSQPTEPTAPATGQTIH